MHNISETTTALYMRVASMSQYCGGTPDFDRAEFRRLMAMGWLEFQRLPDGLREALRTCKPHTAEMAWAQIRMPEEFARQFEGLYNSMQGNSSRVSSCVVELFDDPDRDRFDPFNKVAVVRLTPRRPVTGMLVYEFLLEPLMIYETA